MRATAGATLPRCASSRCPKRSALTAWRRRSRRARTISARTAPTASWRRRRRSRTRRGIIGNIQSRRIDDIARHATLVHSLFQESHIEKFERAAARAERVLDVLVEVNVSGEESKSGCAPAETAALVAKIAACPHLSARGLMTMAPQGDKRAARACFEGLARLKDDVRAGLEGDAAALFNELSMGMSEDWQEAVAAGATMVRIGRAVFDDAFEPPVHGR